MAKKTKPTMTPELEAQTAYVYRVTKAIEITFREQEVTVSDGIMISIVLLYHGIEQTYGYDNKAYGEQTRGMALDALKTLVLLLEKPEAFSEQARTMPFHRM